METTIMENQMEKKMEHEMETGTIIALLRRLTFAARRIRVHGNMIGFLYYSM